MSDISTWSNSAGGNTSASPNGWPEGMPPSGVNDSARENMAAIRRQHEQAEWIDLGHTPTFVTTASFTLVGDQTTNYHAGRRIRATDTSTLYGTIASSTFTSVTRVTSTWDSGQMTASLTAVAVGILSFTNGSLPSLDQTRTYTAKQSFLGGADISGTVSFTSRVVFNDGIDVSGTANFINAPVLQGTAWPSFAAFKDVGESQSIATAGPVLITFGTERFDTNSNYDNSLSYSFTPSVAGKYLLTASLYFQNVAASSTMDLYLYKNSSSYRFVRLESVATPDQQMVTITAVVDANGSTDNFKIYGSSTDGNFDIIGEAAGGMSTFEACRIG